MAADGMAEHFANVLILTQVSKDKTKQMLICIIEQTNLPKTETVKINTKQISSYKMFWSCPGLGKLPSNSCDVPKGNAEHPPHPPGDPLELVPQVSPERGTGVDPPAVPSKSELLSNSPHAPRKHKFPWYLLEASPFK